MNTIDNELFRDAPEDVLRLARWLVAQDAGTLSPQHRLAYAARAHAISRSDIALQLLDGIAASDASSDAVAFGARVCIDSLRLDEAANWLTRYRRDFGADTRLLLLEFSAARAAGAYMPQSIDARTFAATFAVASLDDLARFLLSVPFARLPAAFAARALVAIAPRSPLFGARFLARWVAAGAFQATLRIILALLYAALRIANPGRAIHFAAMGKFTRLAHLIDGLDPILRRLAAEGGSDRHRLYVFYFGGYPNATVFELFKRHCTMVEATSRVPRKLAHLMLAALRRTDNLLSTSNYREVRESMQSNPALLRFEAHEESTLAGRLEAMGIDPARRFILFGLRDMAYYRFYGDATGTPMNKRRAATHHRCPPLATYAAAAQVWAQAGYQVIRVGLRVSEALPSGLDPRVVDYASGARDDALDAFLFSKCWFMIAGDTGLFAGAAAFDRPSVMCDLSIVQTNIYSSNKRTPNVFVPVLFRDLQSGSLLSFREAIYHNYEFMTDEACVAMRVKLLHNSLEDLLDASRELEARLEGRYEEGPDDRERQRAFHAIYQPSHIGFRTTARVSAAFLRKYESLLDTPKGRIK